MRLRAADGAGGAAGADDGETCRFAHKPQLATTSRPASSRTWARALSPARQITTFSGKPLSQKIHHALVRLPDGRIAGATGENYSIHTLYTDRDEGGHVFIYDPHKDTSADLGVPVPHQSHQQAASQKLLLPETVELSARDALFLRQQLQALVRLGVGLSEFGERTFLLDALPPFAKAAQPRRFVLELVDELKAAGQSVNSMRLGETTVAKTVCRHAVKAHDPLSGPEVEKLVEDLRQCAMPYTCPHGRPTLIEMNFRELEKKFGRMQ